MKRVLLTLFLSLVVCCGDNVHPSVIINHDAYSADAFGARTWRDAYRVWADAWCQYAERCYPGDFREFFITQTQCQLQVTDLNCDVSPNPCDADYPQDRNEVLASCHRDMLAIDCSATDVPTFCLAALGIPLRQYVTERPWLSPMSRGFPRTAPRN